MIWAIAAALGAFLAFLMLVRFGLVQVGSRSARNTVAAVSETAASRMADMIERVGNLEADLKGVRREWADFEKSWERRWGTLARQGRRDAARDAAEAAASTTDSDDDAQLPLLAPPALPAPAHPTAARPRLVARSALGR